MFAVKPRLVCLQWTLALCRLENCKHFEKSSWLRCHWAVISTKRFRKWTLIAFGAPFPSFCLQELTCWCWFRENVIEACKKQTFPARFPSRSQVRVERVSYCSRGLQGKPRVCVRLHPSWQVWLVADDDSLVPSSWRGAVSHCQPPHKRQEAFRVIITHKQLMHWK